MLTDFVIEIEDTTVCVDADLVLTTDWYPATRYDTDSEAELNCDVNITTVILSVDEGNEEIDITNSFTGHHLYPQFFDKIKDVLLNDKEED